MPVGTPITGGTGSTWVEVADADTYFGTRHGIGTKWSGLTPTAKVSALTTAQMIIENSGQYDIPDDPTQAMQDAVCEQVFFMLLDPDMELRLAVIAQGVERAGIVDEEYRQGASGEMPIAPLAKNLLKSIILDNNHEIRLVR